MMVSKDLAAMHVYLNRMPRAEGENKFIPAYSLPTD